MRLRVMISSTIANMEPDRSRAAKALEAIGFETLMSERAGSVAAPPKEWCEATARDCDLFILLLGPRYGWIIPDEGCSVVEYEFDTAASVDRSKVLVFLRDMSATVVEERQAVFIDKVCSFSSGHFRSSPYDGIDDLAERVTRDATYWLHERIRQAHFAPEGLALLAARRPLRTVVSDLWVLVLGALLTILAMSFLHPFYAMMISWSQEFEWLRVRWLLVETGATLAASIGAMLLGVSLALVTVVLLARFFRRHVASTMRFLSGVAAGALLPVSLVGPVWFGYSEWQVLLLGMVLVCSATLLRFARFVTDLGSYRVTELLVSLLATGAWIPSFLLGVSFVTVYAGFFLGDGLLDVWLVANRQFLEGVKFGAVLMLLGSIWAVVALGGLALRRVARVFLVRRIGRAKSIEI